MKPLVALTLLLIGTQAQAITTGKFNHRATAGGAHALYIEAMAEMFWIHNHDIHKRQTEWHNWSVDHEFLVGGNSENIATYHYWYLIRWKKDHYNNAQSIVKTWSKRAPMDCSSFGNGGGGPQMP